MVVVMAVLMAVVMAVMAGDGRVMAVVMAVVVAGVMAVVMGVARYGTHAVDSMGLVLVTLVTLTVLVTHCALWDSCCDSMGLVLVPDSLLDQVTVLVMGLMLWSPWASCSSRSSRSSRVARYGTHAVTPWGSYSCHECVP